MKLLIDLLNFVQPYGSWSYAVIFGVLLACGFGLPIPEDITLVTGGILASRGIINFKLCVILCFTGVLMGDGVVFFMGHHFGSRIKGTRFGKFLLPSNRDAKVRAIFDKYGDKVIFMARFMPGFRTPLFFATGTYKVSYLKFLVLDGIAALISVPLWVWVGFLFGSNLEELERVMHKFQYGIYAALGGLVLIFFATRYFKNRVLDAK